MNTILILYVAFSYLFNIGYNSIGRFQKNWNLYLSPITFPIQIGRNAARKNKQVKGKGGGYGI